MRYYYSVILLVFLLLAQIPFSAWAEVLNESLIYHTYFGNAAEVQRLLDKGADPNAKDKHGWTALAIASDRNDAQAYPIAANLIFKGADINAAVGRNFPLVNAILNNNAPLVALLVSKDVNLQITDPKGVPVLSLAKKMGHPDIPYYIEKRLFEEAQLRTYMYSALRQRQIMQKLVMNNCAFQYWSFYLKSEQDKNMDQVALMQRIQSHANLASEAGKTGAQYFAAFQGSNLAEIANSTRSAIFKELNDMISNRNRREMGVGKESDMQKRCGKMVARIPE